MCGRSWRVMQTPGRQYRRGRNRANKEGRLEIQARASALDKIKLAGFAAKQWRQATRRLLSDDRQATAAPAFACRRACRIWLIGQTSSFSSRCPAEHLAFTLVGIIICVKLLAVVPLSNIARIVFSVRCATLADSTSGNHRMASNKLPIKLAAICRPERAVYRYLRIIAAHGPKSGASTPAAS